MKTYIKYTLLIGFCISILSCKKGFLEESSQDLIKPTTIDALNQIMVGEAYSTNNSFLMHPYIEMLTDDVQANFATNSEVSLALNKYNPLFAWQKDMFERLPEAGVEANPWFSYYKRIKGCNVVLDYIDKVTGSDIDRQNLRGQALALRSFYYLMLVNYYGKPYTAGNAESNLGVPLILTSDVTDSELPRATVKAVYDQIEKDLITAVELLNNTDGSNHIYKLNATAARLLLSRVALYKGEWNAAISYSEQVLAKKSALKQLNELPPPSTTVVFPISSGITSPEVIWGYGVYGEVSLIPMAGTQTNKAAFTLSDNLLALYDANDLRPGFYYSSAVYLTNTINVYKGGSAKYKNLSGSNGNGKALRTAEVYLNRAEAYIQKAIAGDQSGIAKALSNINTIRANRIKTANYQPINITDPQALFQFYKEERRRELSIEDHRWFDLRRWGMPSISHTIYQSDGTSTTATLQQNDSRYTLQIPEVVLSRNGQLIQNP
jgi:hypothetical protein